MNERKLVAALACRNAGQRLYGKPLQNLDIEEGTRILDHILDMLDAEPAIDECVLGISEGDDNLPFVRLAEARGVRFIIGDETDVLARLIQCGQAAEATDVFRITTECPFIHCEAIAEAWTRHVHNDNDVTAIEGLPRGALFEIFKLDALETSHREGDAKHRSELCSLFIRENLDRFKTEVIVVDGELARPELRLTVDHPEDLVLCRASYMANRHLAPRIPLVNVIRFVDDNPHLRELVEPFASYTAIWPLPA